MKRFIALAIVAALVVPAFAEILVTPDPGTPTLLGNEQLGPPSRGTIVYSNTATPVAGWAHGSGVEGGDEVEADKSGCPGCDVLDSLKWSVYNSSGATGNLDNVDCVVRIYDTQGVYDPDATNLCAELDFGTLTPGLAPGWYSTYSATELAEYDLCCPDIFTITVTLTTDDVGAAPGQIVCDPPTVGASGDYMWMGGTGWVSFGGSPIANLLYEVDCVPEPASLLLLGLGAMLLRRR